MNYERIQFTYEKTTHGPAGLAHSGHSLHSCHFAKAKPECYHSAKAKPQRKQQLGWRWQGLAAAGSFGSWQSLPAQVVCNWVQLPAAYPNGQVIGQACLIQLALFLGSGLFSAAAVGALLWSSWLVPWCHSKTIEKTGC